MASNYVIYFLFNILGGESHNSISTPFQFLGIQLNSESIFESKLFVQRDFFPSVMFSPDCAMLSDTDKNIFYVCYAYII